MTFSSDMEVEVHRVPLDLNTADRLLAGAIAPEDAPPGYAGVARLLEAASSEPKAEELTGEEEIVAIVASVIRSSSQVSSPSGRRPFLPALSRPRVAAALVAVGLVCSVGLASAGALPGIAQDIASAALTKLGISVPSSTDDAAMALRKRPVSPGTPAPALKRGQSPATPRTARRARVAMATPISTAASRAKTAARPHIPAARAPADTRANGETSGQVTHPARRTTPGGVAESAAIPPWATTSSSRAQQHASASSNRQPATSPRSGKGTADSARRRRGSSGTSTAKQSAVRPDAPGARSASSGQQGVADRSGGQAAGGSGNPGNGGQGGNPAHGGGAPDGSANGNAGRSGRP
jgi:hypothetical protein